MSLNTEKWKFLKTNYFLSLAIQCCLTKHGTIFLILSQKKLHMSSKILHLYLPLIFVRKSRVPWDEGHCSSDIFKTKTNQTKLKFPTDWEIFICWVTLSKYHTHFSYTLMANLLQITKTRDMYLTFTVITAVEIFRETHNLIFLLLGEWLTKPVRKRAVIQGLILTSKILPGGVSFSKVHWSF